MLVVFAIFAAGCVPKYTDKLVGMRKVDPASVSTGDAKSDASQAADIARMTINMKAIKTLTMGDGTTGTYTLTDQAITLPQSVSKGQWAAASDSSHATLSADGSSFSLNVAGAKAMVFKKAAS